MQPASESQLSSVQGFSSSQTGDSPAWQTPSAQASSPLHASPSEQGSVLATFAQPVSGSQLSSVHGFSSSQTSAAPPTQAPSAQVSSTVQTSPSSQGSVFGALTQPVSESQLSSVQGFSSSQVGASPGRQAPSSQTSTPLHASSSEQSPQVPPQPSSPHSLPSQTGAQQLSSKQVSPSRQQPAPHSENRQAQVPSTHSSISGWQSPQEPSQPSSPHCFPSQSGWQTSLHCQGKSPVGSPAAVAALTHMYSPPWGASASTIQPQLRPSAPLPHSTVQRQVASPFGQPLSAPQ